MHENVDSAGLPIARPKQLALQVHRARVAGKSICLAEFCDILECKDQWNAIPFTAIERCHCFSPLRKVKRGLPYATRAQIRARVFLARLNGVEPDQTPLQA